MPKIKLTKNELKKQKDSLKMFKRYLPTLQLKKKQLQTEIKTVINKRAEVREHHNSINHDFKSWIAVFGEKIESLETFLTIGNLHLDETNIAGVSIPVFKGADFILSDYNLFQVPLWVDKALENLKQLLLLDLEDFVLKRQMELLSHELKVTTQRVNLFEKVKIPETKENIRKITIYLGDQQTAAVVRGKISKKKLTKEPAA